MDKKRKTEITGSLLVILAGLSWGCSGIFVRWFSALNLDTMQVTFFKVAFAGTVLLIYTLIFHREALKIKLKDLWIFLGSGLASMVFFTWAYFNTIRATSMSTAAVLLYLAPPMVMIMSAIFFKEKITWNKIAACVLAFAGCVFVSGYIGSGASIPVKALITGLCSALGYALYSIFSQAAINRGYGTLTITTYTFIIAAVGAAFFMRPSQIAAAAQACGSAGKFAGMLILMAIVVSLFPYIVYTAGLSRTTPGKASIIASIEPVMATVVGAVVFHEIPNVYGIIGIILVVSAIVLLNLRLAERKKSI